MTRPAPAELEAPAERADAAAPAAGGPAAGLRGCAARLRGCAGARGPLDLDGGPAPPLAPGLTALTLRPVDRLLALGLGPDGGSSGGAEGDDAEAAGLRGRQAAFAAPGDGSAGIAPSAPSQAPQDAGAGGAAQGGSPCAPPRDLAGRRRWAQAIYIAVSVVLLSVWYYYHLFAAVDGQGGAPVPLKCHSYWTKYATAPFGQSECGLDSGNCGPSDDWVTVRCDGWCAQSQSDPLRLPVVGSGPFRPDSRVCTAGVYAGLVGVTGGCLRVRPGGAASGFAGGGESHGVTSIAFESWYPFSLELAPADGSEHCGYGGWWGLLLLNVALLLGLTLLRPGRRLCWWCLVIAFYWYCALGENGGKDMEGVMQSLGIFALYALAAHVLLWEVGGAKVFFPDTSLGAPLEVLLLEVLPVMPFLHIQLMAYVVGDYDLTGALFQAQDRVGLLVYCVGVLLVVPGAAVILWDWHRAGKLSRFALKTLAGVICIVLLTLLFSTQNYGIHLHHYFIGLVGYLAARGPSRTAAVVRALSLGAFINGMARWGEPTGIPIWSFGDGWYPTAETVDTGAAGAGVNWTDVDALADERAVRLWWAPASEIDVDNCSVAGEEGPQVVVEMNHVEVYRGHARSHVFHLPQPPTSGEESYYYFRVGVVSTGISSGVVSASRVLAVKAGDEPVDLYYNQSAGACERLWVLQHQPASSLRGYL